MSAGRPFGPISAYHATELEVGHAALHHGSDIGRQYTRFSVVTAKPVSFPSFTSEVGRHEVDGEIDLSPEHVGGQRRGALVRNERQADAGLLGNSAEAM